MSSDTTITVTSPLLPPLESLLPYLRSIWDSGLLTNAGPLHQRLELELSHFLGVDQLALFNNGTSALIAAVQALNLSGEIITTPYSFVATAHAISWNGLKPVFVDIDARTFNIDPGQVEAAITNSTSAILAVHCYGNPCDVTALENIGRRYGIKVIYDAAHAFGVIYRSKSLLQWGDLSTLSFHATKVFNTFEGGCVICHSSESKTRLSRLRNFGIVDEETVGDIGMNGKMSEIHAAMGLVQLSCVAEAIERRKKIDQYYRNALKDVPGLTFLDYVPDTIPNYSYFPILVGDEFPLSRDDLHQALLRKGIRSRRYFHPLISNMAPYSGRGGTDRAFPAAERAAKQVLCLPIHPQLTANDMVRILAVIRG